MRVIAFALAVLCSLTVAADPVQPLSNIQRWWMLQQTSLAEDTVILSIETALLDIPHRIELIPVDEVIEIPVTPPASNINQNPHAQPVVAIIIDDIGDKYKAGMRIIDLDGDITLSILPYTPFSKKLAEHALLQNKEVMLHQPMQAIEHKFQHKGTLFTSMSRAEFEKTLDESINSVPHVQGINNHMGSLLTQDDERMNWLMEYLAKRDDLYFIDSRTTAKSVVVVNAEKFFVKNASRDVFLDNSRAEVDIEKQWKYFIKLANQRGSAILIAHPYPETIEFLEKHLVDLDTHGVILVPMSELIQLRDTQRLVLSK